VTGATLQVSLPAGLTFAAASDAGAETAPGQIGWTLGTVAAGSALHRTFDATVAISVAPGATVMPTATLTYDGGLAVDATAEYALAVMASAHPLNVQVTATPDPAVPGGRVLYTVTVGNTSAQAVAAVAVLVRLPIGLQLSRVTDADPDATCGGAATCAAESETSWALGTLPAGGSQTITMNPTVVATAVGDGNLMAASFYVTSNGQNVVQAVKTVSVYSRPQAQLALGTIANPVVPGQAFSLELDVGAMGAAAITGAELSASLPAGLAITAISDGGSQAASGDVVWTIGSLAATAFLHRRIDVTVSATTLVPGMLLGSHATLTYDGGATVDARSQVVIPVIAPPPLLTVAVTATPNPVALDARLTYTATITNVSAQSIAAVGLLFRIPAAGQFARVTDAQPQASCGGAATCTGNAEATWGFGTMAAGAVQTVTVSELMVGTLLPAGSLITTSTWVTAIGLAAPINVQTTVGAHP
jgi:hypothetical protein